MSPQSSRVIQISLGQANAFVIRGKRPILVDTGYPGSAPATIDKLARNGVDPSWLSLIIITHGHADHFGGAAEIKKQTGAPVAIHKLDAEALLEGHDPILKPTGIMGRIFMPLTSRTGPAAAPPLKPDILIGDEMDLRKFGVDGKVIHTPGHTPGSVSIILPTGEFIVGDLIMKGVVRFRQPNYPLYADDMAQLNKSLRLILRKKPVKIYCAHGGPFEAEAVRRRFSIA
jgi:glyoxylase-like metal-dependent hydrolase (beta-lactamase superfamily II)